MCFAGLTLGLLAQITVLVVGICMLLYVYVLSSVGFVCECVCVCVCTHTHTPMCMHACVRNISSRSYCQTPRRLEATGSMGLVRYIEEGEREMTVSNWLPFDFRLL